MMAEMNLGELLACCDSCQFDVTVTCTSFCQTAEQSLKGTSNCKIEMAVIKIERTKSSQLSFTQEKNMVQIKVVSFFYICKIDTGVYKTKTQDQRLKT